MNLQKVRLNQKRLFEKAVSYLLNLFSSQNILNKNGPKL